MHFRKIELLNTGAGRLAVRVRQWLAYQWEEDKRFRAQQREKEALRLGTFRVLALLVGASFVGIVIGIFGTYDVLWGRYGEPMYWPDWVGPPLLVLSPVLLVAGMRRWRRAMAWRWWVTTLRADAVKFEREMKAFRRLGVPVDQRRMIEATREAFQLAVKGND